MFPQPHSGVEISVPSQQNLHSAGMNWNFGNEFIQQIDPFTAHDFKSSLDDGEQLFPNIESQFSPPINEENWGIPEHTESWDTMFT